jgi:hypothetical protein
MLKTERDRYYTDREFLILQQRQRQESNIKKFQRGRLEQLDVPLLSSKKKAHIIADFDATYDIPTLASIDTSVFPALREIHEKDQRHSSGYGRIHKVIFLLFYCHFVQAFNLLSLLLFLQSVLFDS